VLLRGLRHRSRRNPDRRRNHPDPAWWDDLALITAGTLVIGGGPDSHLPQDQVRELASRIHGAEHITIDAGHLVHADRPAEFLAAVEAFLR
jgi:3-oxoadipate enol-lactonase